MTDRPILFSGPMVRALLAGRKTQTRRIVKPQPPADARFTGIHYASTEPSSHFFNSPSGPAKRRCPYGEEGDTLWVREAHAIVPRTAYARSEGVQQTLRPDDNHDACVYREGWERSRPGQWRPSIHMPRWALRLTLEITDVRVERLQDISEADALAEGIEQRGIEFGVPGLWRRPEGPHSAAAAYADLWETINGKGSWAANPWVWAVTFEVEARS